MTGGGDMAGLRCRVTGRVQGVGFRYFTRSLADSLGVTGWVKNCSDGSVEISASGDKTRLQEFLAQVRSGPRFGSVDDVQLVWETQPDCQGFRIIF